MKKFSFLLPAFILFVFYSCTKSPSYYETIPDDGDDSYLIVENFETGKKQAYAAADVELKTGSWNLNDALIGNLATDARDSNWSARIRNGSITSNFNISGLQRVYVYSATFGSDVAATWVFQSSTDGTNFTDVGSPVTVNSNTLRVDSFFITTTAPVKVRIRKTSGNRINIDNIVFIGAAANPGLKTTNPGNPTDTTVTNPPVDGRYVNPGPDAPPLNGDNSNLLFGNPSNADSILAMADNYLINLHYFIESYSSSRGTPNWVAWHIDNTNITGAADRQDNFAPWAGLHNNWYKVQASSYMGSGYDRGHNCPSADRTSSVEANSATFLMVNMIPQTPQNNQQTWNNMEQYIRSQVNAGYEAYVIMGSYGDAGKINNGRITVPTNVWKVVVLLSNGNNDLSRVTATTRVIAVNTPNTSTVNPDWKQYRTSVDAIEQATGYNILSALPVALQNTLGAVVDNQ